MRSPDGEDAAGSALRERLAELDDLGSAVRLLAWDQQVTMPPAGAPARGEVLGTLERISHAHATDPALGALLGELGADPELPAADAALVRVARRDHDRAVRVPEALVGAMAVASSTGQQAWLAAREARDFTLFAPALERNVALRRDLAACFPEVAHPYDALLDVFEPDLTLARLREVFGTLRAGLVPLIAAIAERPRPAELTGPFDPARQRELGLELARALGFEDEGWRLDDAVHPFALHVAASDARVTARFDLGDLSGLFSVLHEMGHGLYEHQVDRALERTTAGTGTSLGIHESQSRLWENLVGRSRAFWVPYWPRLQAAFPAALGGLDLAAFHRANNVVRPSPIRTDADEATYSLHVILRMDLEVALIEGTLAVADVPAAWADGMRDLLGIEVTDPLEGPLQDPHWGFGEFGYFPTYAIGGIVASQLWEAIRRDLPDLEATLERGDTAPLRAWLRDHVHRFGRTRTPAEVLRGATGQDLDPGPLLAHLRAKYGALYDLEEPAA
jgi:carboxypeptidase Taq